LPSHVGVEQEEGDAADLDDPDREADGMGGVLEGDLDQAGPAVGGEHRRRRLAPGLQFGRHVELPAVGVRAAAD
jgi:hypothetical protein